MLLAVASLALGCRQCARSYALRQMQALRITLKSVDVELRTLRPPMLHFTARLDNVNTRWVDLVRADGCLWINGVKMRCQRFPEPGVKVRILGRDAVEIRISIVPGPEDIARALAAGTRGGLNPKAILKGTAKVESPVGDIEFPFETGPLDLDLQRLGVQWNP